MTTYVRELTTEDVQELKTLHRQTKNADVRSRCEMILLSNEGLSPPKIEQRVHFSGRTVRRYIARYEAEGITGLLHKQRLGRPPRVTGAYLELLEQTVHQMPRDLDLPYSNWTTANLAEYMAQKTGIQIQARQMENYLKRNDWRLRRPATTVKHLQDPAAVEAKKSSSAS